MTELETAVFAARMLRGVDRSVLKAQGYFDRKTKIGSYLRALWLALDTITCDLDDPETIGHEYARLKNAERELIEALEVNDG